MIRQAKEGRVLPIKSGGDEVWVEFHVDHVVVTAQWLRETLGGELSIQIPLDETEELFQIWQRELNEYSQTKE